MVLDRIKLNRKSVSTWRSVDVARRLPLPPRGMSVWHELRILNGKSALPTACLA
jgi:hypothetical protein